MKAKILVLLLSVYTVLSAGQNSSRQATAVDSDEFLPGPHFDAFDWRLCNAIARAHSSNVVFSPISVKFLLKMVYEGSAGATSEELSRILELPKDKRVSRMDSRAKILSLQVPSTNYNMEIGMKLFINETVSPKYWYQRILYLYYDAYIEKLNFGDGEAARNRINEWVKSVTHDHIRDLIDSDNSLDSTMALLVSAVYFKGSWRTPFPLSDTYVGKFRTPQGEKDVLYMMQSSYFYYARSTELRSQILRLPYLGRRFAMYIILPDDENGLDQVIGTIKPNDLRRNILQMEEVSVEVILPKFKFDFETRLKDTLQQLGVKRIFESFQDMRGLTVNGEVSQFVVSDVVQKAAVEVNEKGTEAAAATEVQLTNKFGGSDEIFNASHPFLFFVEDESTATIVFVGKIIQPVGYEVPHSTAKTTTTVLPQRRTTKQPGRVSTRSNPR